MPLLVEHDFRVNKVLDNTATYELIRYTSDACGEGGSQCSNALTRRGR